MDTLKISLPELWRNTFCVGRPTSDVWRLGALGQANLATACLMRDSVTEPVESLPSYRMFAGQEYGKLVGASKSADRFSRKYLEFMRKYTIWFLRDGYDPHRSRLSVIRLADGTWRMIDGHRRIAIMMALGCGPMVEVKEGDQRFTDVSCRKVLDRVLPESPFKVAGKQVLYEPVRGFDEYNAPSRTAMFEDALQTVLKITGDPAGLRFLDVGSCFGWFSFGLVSRGGYCTGLDIDGNRLSCCRQLAAYYGMDWSNPLFAGVPAQDFLPAARQNLDWILMMSVFHCLWRKDPHRAKETLRLTLQQAARGVILSMDHGGICTDQQSVAGFLSGLLPGVEVETAGKACGRIVHILRRLG